MTINEFTKQFNKIKKMGFVPSLRKGPTGIGYTLESLLGITENNIILPDIKGIKIKTHRDYGTNLITLFTFNNKIWKMQPIDAVNKYGSFDKNGRKGLNYNIGSRPNSAGLFLHIEHEYVSVCHISGKIVVQWSLNDLEDRFKNEIPSLIFVTAMTEERGSTEYFRYIRASLLKKPKIDFLDVLLFMNKAFFDLCLKDKDILGKQYDSSLRVFDNELPQLFGARIDL